jgi:hypothetical protein
MNLFRSTLVAGVALAIVAFVSSLAQAAQKQAKQIKTLTVVGLVTAVEQDKEKRGGTITVKLNAAKKNADPAAKPEEKKYTLSQDVKIEKLSGTKDNLERSAGTFTDIHQGNVVALALKDSKSNVVERVEIRPGKKGKAK